MRMKRKDSRRIKALFVSCALCVLTAAVLSMQGCTARTSRGKNMKIGVVVYNQTDTFLGELLQLFQKDVDGLRRDGEETAVLIRDAAGSQRTEDAEVQELLDNGCNVLCVNLVDRGVPSNIINMAKEADVPVIFFNREPVREDMNLWSRLYYIGTDAAQSGRMQGELAAAAILSNSRIDKNSDGKIQYVVLEGEPGHQDTIMRTDRAVATLIEKGVSLDKLSYQIANFSRAQAANKMTQLIGQFGNKIELVLANNDAMALGAIDAYNRLTITETNRPVFLGIDGTKEGLSAVIDGSLAGTVYNDKNGQAMQMAKLCDALFHGDSLDGFGLRDGKYIYLPYEKVTAENVRKYVVKQDE